MLNVVTRGVFVPVGAGTSGGVPGSSSCNSPGIGNPAVKGCGLIRSEPDGRGRAVTKNELIAAVADKTRMPRMLAAAAVDATFEIMTTTLEQGDEVKITGFGNFPLIKRAARE